jgi:phosphatidylglycerol lysyltransferase
MTTSKPFLLKLITYGVAIHGLFYIVSNFIEEFITHRGMGIHFYISEFNVSLPVLFGFTLLYISMYLRRAKWTAWVAAVSIYAVILIVSSIRLFIASVTVDHQLLYMFRGILLPSLILLGLVGYASYFRIRSDIRSFAFSLRFIVLMLAITFVYGVSGMLIMSHSDFHQEITLSKAVHQTIDQMGLTTEELKPHTKRAYIFMDSLTMVSVASVGYGLASLFQPLRARLANQSAQRRKARRLLELYGGDSEDFFKLWPHDKHYFFSANQTSGIAYRVQRGVLVTVGDPFGQSSEVPALLSEFEDFCRLNDWRPAFVHTAPHLTRAYKEAGYTLQKIGEEAIVSLDTFTTVTARKKYFRQIRNRFKKAGYTVELLSPPHSTAVMTQIGNISNAWTRQPGRAERGFLMGWYNEPYIQQCRLAVLKDADGTIQGFINQIESFDPDEANFDFLRHSSKAPSNSNDYLLMEFAAVLYKQGFKRLNMGLCPLSGLDMRDESRKVINTALQFVYSNGDRFYSFNGLRRFKAKYEPQWESRYVAYKGGIPNFSRAIIALDRVLRP